MPPRDQRANFLLVAGQDTVLVLGAGLYRIFLVRRTPPHFIATPWELPNKA
jgi:hypothetical protein